MDLESFCNYNKDIDHLQPRDLLDNNLYDGEIDLVQVDFAYGQKAALKQFIKKNLIYACDLYEKRFHFIDFNGQTNFLLRMI